jgi:hypothetical protein
LFCSAFSKAEAQRLERYSAFLFYSFFFVPVLAKKKRLNYFRLYYGENIIIMSKISLGIGEIPYRQLKSVNSCLQEPIG